LRWRVRFLAERLADNLLGYQAEMFCSTHDVTQLAAAEFAQGRMVASELALPVYLHNQVTNRAAK
jgi:hypothetical protein